MKKHFRSLLVGVLTLAYLCSGMLAFAAEDTANIPAAEPTTKSGPATYEPDGNLPNSMRDFIGFTTSYCLPFRFVQADHKASIQRYGDAPTEDAVVLIRLYTNGTANDQPINLSGHSFITLTNVTDSDLNIGGLMIAPDTSITVGTRSNRAEHKGIWYNYEGYAAYYSNFYENRITIQASLDADQLAVVNENISRSDKWSVTSNCSAFATNIWNSVCADRVDAGIPNMPYDLRCYIMAHYADYAVAMAEVPYDYAVYCGYPAQRSKYYN